MKYYSMMFGETGDPRSYTGLSPTFLIFVRLTDGQTIAPPSITESLTGSGIYQFQWGTTQPIAFLADAATTSPGSVGRYVTGSVDPADRADEYGNTMIAIGTTTIAQGVTSIAIGTSLTQGLVDQGSTIVGIGNSLSAIGVSFSALGNSLGVLILSIGSTASSYGTDVADPVDLFGYLKRVQNFLEGNQIYTKQSGSWAIYARFSSQLFVTKTIANSVSTVIKT